jgi:hypothetical protein
MEGKNLILKLETNIEHARQYQMNIAKDGFYHKIYHKQIFFLKIKF